MPLKLLSASKRLSVDLLGLPGEQSSEGEWLLGLREASEAGLLRALAQALLLTLRSAEVLYWVTQGKTNRDIGEILGTSLRTVHKHLEPVFEKLGVETRTAAAAVALGKRQPPSASGG